MSAGGGGGGGGEGSLGGDLTRVGGGGAVLARMGGVRGVIALNSYSDVRLTTGGGVGGGVGSFSSSGGGVNLSFFISKAG